MKIASSTVAMEGRSELTQQLKIQESFSFEVNTAPSGRKLPSGGIQIEISLESLQKAQQTSTEEEVQLSPKEMIKLRVAEEILFMTTGKRVKLRLADLGRAEANQVQAQAAQTGEGPRRLAWNLDYEYSEQFTEAEAMRFAAAGQVKTEDGKVIDFSVQLSASREFFSERTVRLHASGGSEPEPPPQQQMVDPLVLNLSGASVSLGERNFQFDLDADGKQDTMAFVGAGSAFLALDKNGNSQIDDGSELFGPQSGNGFEELAAYDSDGNDWIDENDPIYDKLRLWSKDESGKLQLLALGKAGVGALYLGHLTTPFRLASGDGQIARSGVYLREDGLAGTMQHVDLAV